MPNILIVGVGLIGGSIALSIKKDSDATIYGYDVSKENCSTAKKLGVIDVISNHFEKDALIADLIIIATPVEVTLEVLDHLSKIKPSISAIVMDVGSTKKSIMQKAEVLAESGIIFIGGHPMAGSHKTGVESAKAHLFENAYFILTPSSITTSKEIDKVQHMLKGTLAKFLVIQPEEHDFITGIVSHFPHLIATSLVRIAHRYSGEYPLVQELAAGGFRDITRIASSSPKMWTDIVSQNKQNLLELIKGWQSEMNHVKEIIEIGNQETLLNYFQDGKDFRDGLPVRSQGAIKPFSDLYVDILDQVGSLANVTTLLADSQISIVNLVILEVREGLDGVLRISFQNEIDRDRAEQILRRENFITHISS